MDTKHSEIATDEDIRIAEIFASIPSEMIGNRKSRLFHIKVDPIEAEKTFRQAFKDVVRKEFIAPKTHYSQVSDKPISLSKGIR